MLVKNKRGISEIVVTVIIILLAIVAFAVISVVVRGTVSSGAENIELSSNCLEVEMHADKIVKALDGNQQFVGYDVTVSRSSSGKALDGVKLMIENEDNSISSNDVIDTIKSLDKKTYTVPSGVNWTTGVKLGNAMTFDGVDDYISLPAFTNPDLTDYSTSIWFYMFAHQTGTGARSYIYDFRGDGAVVNPKAILLLIDKNPTNNQGIIGAYSGVELKTGPVDVLNQWHNAVITRKGTTTNIYLDGALIKSGDAGLGGDLDGPKRIGTYSIATSGSYFFKGSMDELMIFSRALSSTEISELYTGDLVNHATYPAIDKVKVTVVPFFMKKSGELFYCENTQTDELVVKSV